MNGLKSHIIWAKRYKEAFVKNVLSKIVTDVYVPLFSSYLGALIALDRFSLVAFPRAFDAASFVYKHRHCQGVTGIVCAGRSYAAPIFQIIEQIRNREKNGLIRLNPKMQPQQRVSILDCPFQGIEAVFERLSQRPG